MPIQKRKDLVELIAKQTLKPKVSSHLVDDIATILLAKNYVNDLGSIMRDVIEYRIKSGIVEARITTAYKLNSTTRTDIEHLIKKHYPDSKKIILNEVIDVKTIGGVRISLPSQELDLSIRRKLDELRSLTTQESAGV